MFFSDHNTSVPHGVNVSPSDGWQDVAKALAEPLIVLVPVILFILVTLVLL